MFHPGILIRLYHSGSSCHTNGFLMVHRVLVVLDRNASANPTVRHCIDHKVYARSSHLGAHWTTLVTRYASSSREEKEVRKAQLSESDRQVLATTIIPSDIRAVTFSSRNSMFVSGIRDSMSVKMFPVRLKCPASVKRP